uniref:Uncharacterized protein n=1 Tax=Trypanosoma vivax (strain Y486) TaxID=1055687 RepID=G0U040_TRYVY|nr:hypothetical protein, unlikely [Trypanosoma vivax Y486]
MLNCFWLTSHESFCCPGTKDQQTAVYNGGRTMIYRSKTKTKNHTLTRQRDKGSKSHTHTKKNIYRERKKATMIYVPLLAASTFITFCFSPPNKQLALRERKKQTNNQTKKKNTCECI